VSNCSIDVTVGVPADVTVSVFAVVFPVLSAASKRVAAEVPGKEKLPAGNIYE